MNQQFKGDHAAAGRKMDTMSGKLVDTRPRLKVPAPVASKTSHVVYGEVPDVVETKDAVEADTKAAE